MSLVAGASVAVGAVSVADPWLWVSVRALATLAVTFVLLDHFQLRARAFSPSLSEARLIALQARIRPHFLFNSLNTVLGLLRSDPRQAESTLQDLSELFRVFMRDTRELVPLSAELETCRQYLAIETLRLKPRLEVHWALSNLPMDALVPSLLIQPLIENAVHHGIEPSSDPGLVEVSGQLRVDRIWIEIVNPLPAKGTGPGRMGNQMALSNVRERLMLLFDMEAELRMDIEGDRFRLTLDFPYRPERRGPHE
jgi:two-component system sensor histidine kinase AlgZ